eukprot:COSAG01_NODE_75784_length_193_cov_16.723404_1_plen_44_part_10
MESIYHRHRHRRLRFLNAPWMPALTAALRVENARRRVATGHMSY